MTVDIEKQFCYRHPDRETLFQIATAAAVLGSLASVVPGLLGLLVLLVSGEPQAALAIIWSVLWPGVYTFLVGSTVYYRLGGIQIR